MIPWLAVGVAGGGLAIWGLVESFRRYRRGEVTLRFFLAAVVGFVSFVSYAVVMALRPDISGLATLAVLLPAFLAIVVVVREQQPHR